jgi:hypothetical protein
LVKSPIHPLFNSFPKVVASVSSQMDAQGNTALIVRRCLLRDLWKPRQYRAVREDRP